MIKNNKDNKKKTVERLILYYDTILEQRKWQIVCDENKNKTAKRNKLTSGRNILIKTKLFKRKIIITTLL